MVSSRTIAKVFLIAAAIYAGLQLLYMVREVLGLIAIAVFLAVALGPAVTLVHRRGVPRSLAILLVYAAILLLLVGIGLLIVPPVVREVDALVSQVPEYIDQLRTSPAIADYDRRYQVTDALRRQAEGLPQGLGDAVGALRSVTVGVFSTLFQLLTILVITFFLLLEGRRLTDLFFAQLGSEREPRARAVAAQVYKAVGGYVTGAFTIALIAGTSSYVVMKIIGIPFAEALAVFVLFLDLIPLVGASIAGALIAVVAALSDFPSDLIVWAVFFLVYQQVENNVLQPFVYKRTVALSPLLVIIAVLLGGSLLGVLGALLSIPVAAALQILARTYLPLSPATTGEADDGPPGAGGGAGSAGGDETSRSTPPTPSPPRVGPPPGPDPQPT